MDKKQEELGKLYTLRAGLSVISQKSDDYKRNEQVYNNRQSYLSNNFEYKNENQVESNYYANVNDIEDRKKIAQKKLKESADELKVETFKFIIEIAKSTILFILGIPLTVFFWIGILLIIKGAEIYDEEKDFYRWAKEDYKKCVEECNKINSSYEWDIKQAEETRDNNYYRLLEYKKAEKETISYLGNLKSQQAEIVKASNAVENALIKEYNSMLDIRDWENLDLVIYYYETRRADSIKEALQLVDMERRNNELINSIKYASNEICRTIRSSIQVLGEVLVAGFNSLSAQLEAQRVQTMGALQQINQSISGVLTQQTLNNALLAKANVSSRQMVEQMKTLNNKLK